MIEALASNFPNTHVSEMWIVKSRKFVVPVASGIFSYSVALHSVAFCFTALPTSKQKLILATCISVFQGHGAVSMVRAESVLSEQLAGLSEARCRLM